jgi:hypothetical protein
VIVVIGFYVVQWEVGTLVKYLVISCAALLVTLPSTTSASGAPL